MKPKQHRLDKVKVLKELARERVGPPKPVQVLKSKKQRRLSKAAIKDLNDDQFITWLKDKFTSL